MATEHVLQIDGALKEFGAALHKSAQEAGRIAKDLNKMKEKEGKPMKFNEEVKKSERKVIEEYWVIRAEKDGSHPVPLTEGVKETQCDHEPTLQEIAQFLEDTKMDCATVRHKYRFDPDLPFCREGDKMCKVNSEVHTDTHKSAVLQGLDNMKEYDGYGGGIVYSVGDIDYSLDQIKKEVELGTDVGEKFSQEIYDTIVSYMGKFTQN